MSRVSRRQITRLILVKESLPASSILLAGTISGTAMCNNCGDRALKLRRLAIDFRTLAQKPGSDPNLPGRLIETALELEALADTLCAEAAPRLVPDDVVWAEPQDAGDDCECSPAAAV